MAGRWGPGATGRRASAVGLALLAVGLCAPQALAANLQATPVLVTTDQATHLTSLSSFCTPGAVGAPETGGGAAGAGPDGMPAPSTVFAGLSETQSPFHLDFGGDISGAIGPNDYVQTINDAVGIYSRTGQLRCTPVDTGAFWATAAAPCNFGTWTDTIVEYDRSADRWFISRFVLQGSDGANWTQCVAVSKTGDPTGGYYRYAFKIGTSLYPYFNDYEKFGIWPDAYYMTAEADQIFRPDGKGIYVDALDRKAMLAGQDAKQVLFFVPFLVGTAGQNQMSMMQPANWDGPVAPPAGSPGLMAQLEDDNLGFEGDELTLWAFHVDWSDPGSSTLTVAAQLATDAFNSNVCMPADAVDAPNQFCIVQKDTSQTLDPLAYGYTGFRLVYRNLGSHQAMVLADTVAASDSTSHTAIRWYELRSTGGPWSIHQQGTYAPDGDDRWLPSPGIDRAGNIAIGFNVSGTDTYPSVRYVGREAGDPLGTLPHGEATIVNGTGAQTDGPEFGDYTQMTVDPVDDCTLWHTGPYYKATNSNHDFDTRVGAFKFASCTDEPPAFTSADHATATIGEPFTFLVTTTGGPPPSLAETGTLPSGITFTDNHDGTATIQGTADLGTAGTYPLELTAKNAFGATQDFTLTVERAPTTTKLTSDTNPSVVGQPVTLTATVTPALVDGDVTFRDGVAVLGTVDLVANTATITVPFDVVATHHLTATYNGDVSFKPSTSGVLDQVVNKGQTTSTVTATPASSVYGHQVTFDATVSAKPPAAGIPTGTVNYILDGQPWATAQLAGGKASVSSSSIDAGTHTMAVQYTGDDRFLASTSPATTFVVQKAPTTLTAAPVLLRLGPPLGVTVGIVRATLTRTDNGAPIAGQPIQFTALTTNLCSATTGADGVATCTYRILSVVPLLLAGGDTATFAGSKNYLPSSSHGPLIG